MKKLLLTICLITVAQLSFAQGFGAAISGGYLTEIDSFGASGDLIYEFNEKWGVGTTITYSVAEEGSIRTKWLALDLNARYKVIDELYVLAGGEFLDIKYKSQGLGGGDPLDPDVTLDATEFGANIGTGYKYNLIDNVNVFAEVKYVLMDQGYVHARLGLHFDFN